MSELPVRRRTARTTIAIALTAVTALLAPACRPVGGESAEPPVAGVSPSRNTAKPSGRRPGVVNINTEQGLRNTGAAGTGIVLDPSGLVLTNNHVISGATDIRATDTDNHRSYPAKIVGYDKLDDIAVIRLTGATGLKAAAFGDSGAVRIGDPVTAVGNAGGKGGTPSVVTGRVTALGREVVARDESDGTSERLTGLIETSAPIKPGDSGGPLLSTAGRVIGINTAASAGYAMKQPGTHRGYAIPSGKALSVARQIQRGEASDRIHIGPTALLGVQVRQYGAGQGALVSDVIPDTPADAANIPVGAAIVALGGRPVDTPGTLTTLMLTHHPGETVRVEWVQANGDRAAADVRLTDGPPQ